MRAPGKKLSYCLLIHRVLLGLTGCNGARIIYEDVYAASFLDNLTHNIVNMVAVRHIHLKKMNVLALEARHSL